MNLIAFNGRAGAGKDTAADILVRHAGFQKLAFADTLHAEVAEAFGIAAHGKILHDRELKEQPHDALTLRHCRQFGFIGAVAMATGARVDAQWLDEPRSPRQILQWWGTEYRLAQDPRYWVKAMASRIEARKAPMAGSTRPARFVITDCEHRNEYAYVRSVGGRVWRVRDVETPATCIYPSCNCPMDAPADPSWCLKKLPKDDLARLPVDIELQITANVHDLRNKVLRHWWAADSGIPAGQLRVEVLA